MCGVGRVPHIFFTWPAGLCLVRLIIACPANLYLILQNAEVYASLFELLLLFSKIA